MRISAVRQQLMDSGVLDGRGLLTYATLTGTVQGTEFQNIVAICFGETALRLYRANLDNTLGDLLAEYPYGAIKTLERRERFLYGYTRFRCGDDSCRFFNYDKKVFAKGLSDAGLI